jgi:hypothetical protein
MNLRPALVGLATLAIGACAGGGTSVGDTERAAFGRTEAPDPSPLARIDIPSGECGMILWARSGARTVPIFRAVNVVDAVMTVDGSDVPLQLASQDGPLRLGMRAKQLFVADGNGDAATPRLTVAASIEWGQPFPGGTYISGGTLTLTGESGWQRIVPVAGIAGCKR